MNASIGVEEEKEEKEEEEEEDDDDDDAEGEEEGASLPARPKPTANHALSDALERIGSTLRRAARASEKR